MRAILLLFLESPYREVIRGFLVSASIPFLGLFCSAVWRRGNYIGLEKNKQTDTEGENII